MELSHMLHGLMPARVSVSYALVAVMAGLLILTPAVAHAQVVAVVYGEPITARDIDQRSRFEAVSGNKSMSRQEALDALINDKLKIREAARFGISVSDSEVNDAYANMAGRMRLKPDQLATVLERSGTSAKVFQSRIRADMTWSRLIRGRFASTLSVGERDILTALGSQTTAADATGYEYALRPILFVVPKGSGEGLVAARRREAEALRARFEGCQDGLRATRGLRGVVVRERIIRATGDLGPQQLKVIDATEIGKLTAPEVTEHGVEMVAVCGKTQVRGDTPEKKAAREALVAKRFDVQADRYLKDLRRRAMIEYKNR